MMSKTHIYEVKDLITKEIFRSHSILSLSRLLKIDRGSLQRLLNRNLKGKQYASLKDRYVNLFDSKTFTFVDYSSGEEFECCSNATLFLYFDLPWNENISKHMTAVKCQKQKILSFENKVLYLKGFKPTKIRPQKSMTEEYLKQLAFEKLNREIKSTVTGRIFKALKNSGVTKNKKTLFLLGCSIEELKKHIESQFESWMGWNNHGNERVNGEKSWHIDHITPCNTFDLTKEEEQMKCFHYTNLRPLSEAQNLSRPKDGKDLF